MFDQSADDASATLVSALIQLKFVPGRIVATPAALSTLEAWGCRASSLLVRHLSGDWGDLPPEDARANDEALEFEERVLSSYLLNADVRIWIITEADRSVTTLLLPSEY